jgi:hypothetical protein
LGDSKSNIDYRALEIFVNNVKLTYFDYGRYMRRDGDGDNFVEIPTYCIDEVIENGMAYGIYHRGTPGCEVAVIQPMTSTTPAEGGTTPTDTADPNAVVVPVEDIKIQRDYRSLVDRDAYKNDGDGKGAGEGDGRDGGGFYFESKCAVYTDDGFDEAATRVECPLSATGAVIRDSSNGWSTADNQLVLNFSTTVALNKEVFKAVNRHMRVVSPTRQNVTDSYTQIRDMFAEAPTGCAPGETECLEQIENADNELNNRGTQ